MCRRKRLFVGSTPGGSAAAASAQALLAYDKLLGVSIGYGPVAGGRVVRIIGVGFTGATGVTFGGTAGTSFSVVSDQLIEVTAPAKTAGAYDVVVQHPGGDSTISSGFTFVALPVISGSSLDVSTFSYAGGILVRVSSCTGIRAGMTVTLGGVSQGTIIYVNATTFDFIVRGVTVANVGAKDLVITDQFGATSTKSSAFTFSATYQIPQFTSGSAMDAQATATGRIFELIGATTGARIGLFEVQNLSPVRYKTRSPIDLYQSNGGAEFSGVIAFEALGTGSVPSWASSTPGSTTVGGPVFTGTGTFKLNGLAFMDGKRRNSFRAKLYMDTRVEATTNNWIYIGVVSDADDTTISCTGHGKSGTGWANGASADGAVNAPTPAYNTNFSAAPTEDVDHELTFSGYPYNGNPAAGMQLQGGMTSAAQSGITSGTNDATSGHVADTDLQLAMGGVLGTGSKIHINTITVWVD